MGNTIVDALFKKRSHCWKCYHKHPQQRGETEKLYKLEIQKPFVYDSRGYLIFDPEHLRDHNISQYFSSFACDRNNRVYIYQYTACPLCMNDQLYQQYNWVYHPEGLWHLDLP